DHPVAAREDRAAGRTERQVGLVAEADADEGGLDRRRHPLERAASASHGVFVAPDTAGSVPARTTPATRTRVRGSPAPRRLRADAPAIMAVPSGAVNRRGARGYLLGRPLAFDRSAELFQIEAAGLD